MGFVIRRATEIDTDRIAPLFDFYRQFYGKPPDPETARTFIHERLRRTESVIFLAEDGAGRALGFVQLFPSFTSVEAGRLWVLNDLFVVADARRLGIARALMEAAREHAVRSGARRLTLETVSENRQAWSLYESLGYVPAEENVRFYTLELE